MPGQTVSADHFICSSKGRLFTSKGRESEQEMYEGGCLFVDHATGYINVQFQTSLNSHQTLKAKQQFEEHCRDHGVLVQRYQTDNGSSFTSAAFAERLKDFAQIIRFAGVGAHHHNGVAERGIQTVMSIARTMMLHAAIHWPEVAEPRLWPMAVEHAVYLHNHVPNEKTGLSAHDLFTRSRWDHKQFHQLHVWGCPTYVLSKTHAGWTKVTKVTSSINKSDDDWYITTTRQHSTTGAQPHNRCHHATIPHRL